jgi:hypothetical protein
VKEDEHCLAEQVDEVTSILHDWLA